MPMKKAHLQPVDSGPATPAKKRAVSKPADLSNLQDSPNWIRASRSETGVLTIEIEAPQQNRLKEALRSPDFVFLQSRISDAMNVGKLDSANIEASTNSTLATIQAIGPRDPVETLLATQMTAVHNSVVSFSGFLSRCENVDRAAEYEKSLNRLARTFAAQVEALNKYRVKGKQKITVQHVTVEDGAQAVIGDVTSNKGG